MGSVFCCSLQTNSEIKDEHVLVNACGILVVRPQRDENLRDNIEVDLKGKLPGVWTGFVTSSSGVLL